MSKFRDAACLRQYDDAGRLSSLKYGTAADTGSVKSYVYGYDLNNNIQTINEDYFSYDEMNRLTYSLEKGKFLTDSDIEYGYDNVRFVGNRKDYFGERAMFDAENFVTGLQAESKIPRRRHRASIQ